MRVLNDVYISGRPWPTATGHGRPQSRDCPFYDAGDEIKTVLYHFIKRIKDLNQNYDTS